MSETTQPMDLREYFDVVKEFCIDIESRTIPHSKSDTSKRIGTYFEKEFRKWCEKKIGLVSQGSVAKGLDLPAFNLDVKSTSNRQPQSSSPFDDPGERILGVDYNILLFVYDRKRGEEGNKFEIKSCVYIPKERTADYRKSKKARNLVEKFRKGNISEEVLREKIEDLTGLSAISDENFNKIKENPPKKGTITITPAVQWRFNYNQVVGSPVPEGANKIYSSRDIQRTLSDSSE